jgi:hypothetical protein
MTQNPYLRAATAPSLKAGIKAQASLARAKRAKPKTKSKPAKPAKP